ncbi:hypothetical protein B7P43_G16310 [Cryptotermes secundus]|uniref:t-SNARE coiled-coil homology domain-containing protein n=1 Tax=Cryptotermes secundus TaxID=105785 RepID=A0A2J7PPL5_9NEOP|nr:hypothetical protein B7P43_G16310 [Cryptotermes secundus]
MVKDRLPDLRLVQRSQSYSSDEVCLKIGKKTNAITQFLDKVERIQNGIESINTNIDEIKRLNSIILLLPQGKGTSNSEVEDRKMCVSRTIYQVQYDIKVNREATSEELEHLLENSEVAVFVDNIVADTLEAQLALTSVKARHGELLEVESSVKEIRDIFVQMATLVEAQGDNVKRVEFHVVKAGGHADLGNTRLRKAKKLKKKRRKIKFILVVSLIILLGIVLILLTI